MRTKKRGERKDEGQRLVPGEGAARGEPGYLCGKGAGEGLVPGWHSTMQVRGFHRCGHTAVFGQRQPGPGRGLHGLQSTHLEQTQVSQL